MPLERLIEDFDLVVKRSAAGAYFIAQHLDGRDEVIEEGPLNAADAQAQAIALAHAQGSDAWLEEYPGSVRPLN